MTNLSFGSKISVTGESKLKEFQLGYKWKQNPGTASFIKHKQTIAQKTPPQELFIERKKERCLQKKEKWL